jgi:hypothetical protein
MTGRIGKEHFVSIGMKTKKETQMRKKYIAKDVAKQSK